MQFLQVCVCLQPLYEAHMCCTRKSTGLYCVQTMESEQFAQPSLRHLFEGNTGCIVS